MQTKQGKLSLKQKENEEKNGQRRRESNERSQEKMREQTCCLTKTKRKTEKEKNIIRQSIFILSFGGDLFDMTKSVGDRKKTHIYHKKNIKITQKIKEKSLYFSVNS